MPYGRLCTSFADACIASVPLNGGSSVKSRMRQEKRRIAFGIKCVACLACLLRPMEALYKPISATMVPCTRRHRGTIERRAKVALPTHPNYVKRYETVWHNGNKTITACRPRRNTSKNISLRSSKSWNISCKRESWTLPWMKPRESTTPRRGTPPGEIRRDGWSATILHCRLARGTTRTRARPRN